jgi:hypothetical protein
MPALLVTTLHDLRIIHADPASVDRYAAAPAWEHGSRRGENAPMRPHCQQCIL